MADLPSLTDKVTTQLVATMGTNLVDKLKNIRPFTEGQLLSLHLVDELDDNESFVDSFLKECILVQETDFFAKLGKVRKWKYLLDKTRTVINEKTSVVEGLQDTCWTLNTQTITEKGRCSDRRYVDVKHSFVESMFHPEPVKTMEQSFLTLQEILPSEFSVHYFMSQISEKHVYQDMKEVIALPDHSSSTDELKNSKVSKLKSLISCLFAYIRCEDLKSDHFLSSREWLSKLIDLLFRESEDLRDRLFVLNHVLRCSGGISKWATGYVQFPSPLDAEDVDSAMLNINYSLTALNTILSPIKGREKFLGIYNSGSASSTHSKLMSKSASPSPDSAAIITSDESWLLVDADTEESEEYFANRINFTEHDIIGLLKQIPFVSIMKFMTEGSEKLNANGCHCLFGQFTEIAMLKLLAVSTRIIKILRQGLITFNCMQFKSLTEYITLLIKVTVKSVSKFWSQCKSNIHSDDQGLFLRLQVEYDHFILRSITTILESQRYGIWKFVSVIPFAGVTEAMMWHILWVFYNNGRDESDDLGGLCPYVSDSYWKAKFEEPALKYLFHEKLPSLSTSECHSLLDCLGNMVKSRDAREVEFITTVTSEMLELCFMSPGSHRPGDQLVKKCTAIYSQIARQHPFFISSLIHKIKQASPRNESIIESLSEIPCDTWKPTQEDLDIVIEWLVNTSINHFSNRLARVFFTKINWGVSREAKKLHMDVSVHRNLAIQLYNAAKMHVYVDDTEDPFNTSTFTGFDGKSTLTLAKSPKPKDFIEWCWRLLLTLKLHLFEQPFDRTISTPTPDYASLGPSFSSSSQASGLGQFPPPPNLDSDTALLPIAKGLQQQNPFAIYIALSMTEKGHRPDLLEENLKRLVVLINGKNFIQTLSILSWFIPLNIDSADAIVKSVKFVTACHYLLVSEQDDLLDRLLGLIRRQLEVHSETKIKLLTFWIELLDEVSNQAVKSSKLWSSSWLTSSKSLQQVVHLYDNLLKLTSHDDLLHPHLVEMAMKKQYDELFARQLSTPGLMSWIPFTGNNTPKKCEWITPMHVMQQKFSDHVWLSWLVIKSDMLKIEEIWQEILSELNDNYDTPTEMIVKNVCTTHSLDVIPMDLLPVNSWGRLLLDTPPDHPLLPLISFNFFKCFFSSTPTGSSLGHKFLTESMVRALKAKITLMADYHHREWSAASEKVDIQHHSENTKLYRAFLHWLEEAHLHDPYVDFNRLPSHFLTELLKLAMDGSPESVMTSYLDHTTTFAHEEQLLKLWMDVKHFDADVAPIVLDFSQLDDDIQDTIQSIPESKVSNLEPFVGSEGEPIPEGSGPAVGALLQHNIRSVMEEGRFFSTRLEKFVDINKHFLDLLPDRYKNVKKDVTLKGTCDKDGYDLDGCKGPAVVTISFAEASENTAVVKEIERNRLDSNKLLLELMETPSDKIVSSVIHTEKYVNVLMKSSQPQDHKVLSDLLAYLLSWIQDKETVSYPPTKYLFNSFMETLKTNSEEERDRTSLFLLQTAISHPHLVEYFAPRLVPSLCSPTTFLRMYQIMQEKNTLLPPQVTFVLLSKFDVASWFKKVPESMVLTFHQTLGAAIYSLGLRPAEDQLMTLGLYRKHLQYSLMFQFPVYLTNITTLLLTGMSQFHLYPSLWNDVLLSFGLYIKPQLSPPDIVVEIKKYAKSQPLFSSSELFALLKLIAQHFSEMKKQQPKTEMLEFYKDYVHDLLMVLSSLSVMWVNVNHRVLCENLENIWTPLLEAWSPWIYPIDLNRLGKNKDFEQVWFFYTETLLYLIGSFERFSTDIVYLVKQTLSQYLADTNCIDCPNLSLIQEQLDRLNQAHT